MTIFYPDIYSGQAGISLKGALAVTCKATEGTRYVNPDYAAAKARAASSGTFFGAYHFLLAGQAAAQAAHAFATAGRGVPLMVDFEPEAQAASSPSVADATAFIDAYRALGGMTHLLYLPRWYWDQLGRPSLAPFASRGMVLVSSDYTAYTDAAAGAGWQPYGGMTPAVWQYSSTLLFNGHRCDFNAFRGTFAGKQDPGSVAACLAEFRALATAGKYATPGGDDWAYGAPLNLRATGGHESVRLTWDAPAGAPGKPDHYDVFVYRGAVCNTRTIVASYPRTAAASPWEGGSLQRGHAYTAHVVASGKGGAHTGPYVYASAEFRTG
ncbi:MAG TPA: GH25 family lysozyme [Trebonia sp.]